MERPILNAYDRRRIENLSNRILFDELLAFASEASLGRRLDIKPYDRDSTPEAEIIAKLGVRGLRSAIDLTNNNHYELEFSGERTDDEDGTEYIWVDSPMREPTSFSDQPDFEILDKTRQFGEALLGEAYRTLGQDVHDKIRDFKSAESDDDQMKVISWLDSRLEEMAETKHGLVAEDKDKETHGFYHPIRLSPKAIGIYPHHNLAPTCLGVSVIAASFFHQCEAAHLHTGVMVSSNQALYRSIMGLLGVIESELKANQQFVPDAIISGLKDKRSGIYGRYKKDEGYHAANFVRLNSGKWCQVDSNFDATIVLQHDGHNAKLNHAYDELTQLDSMAPGLESSVELPLTSISTDIQDWIEAIDISDIDPAIVRTILINETDSIPEKIKQACIDPVFMKRPDGLPEMVTSNIDGVLNYTFKDDVFYNLFSKYVLWGQTLLEVQKRCRSDPSYLDRRVTDVQNLPLVMAGSIAMRYEDFHRIMPTDIPHDLLEAGLPARRIGMAVLGDFATYCDDRLPPSFWISNWPSHVPLTETLDGPSRTEGQMSITYNNAAWLYSMHLSYAKTHDIIPRFMDAQKKERQDGNS